MKAEACHCALMGPNNLYTRGVWDRPNPDSGIWGCRKHQFLKGKRPRIRAPEVKCTNTLLYSKKDSHNYKQLLLLFPACNYLPEQQCLRKPRENAAEMVKDLKGELTVQKTWGR